MVGNHEIPTPPTARERAAFDAATIGTPKDFVRTCRAARIEPGQLLDAIDAAPWRWLFSFSPEDVITDEVRHRTFQPQVRQRLDATRDYVATSWWRRTFSPPEAFDPTARQPYLRRRLPDR
jgi:hypothetical protein